MASLKEIKGRIASVRNTLKITSAMKMVASAKLHKAQQAIGNMLPYERHLHDILVNLIPSGEAAGLSLSTERPVKRVAIVAFSSNSSLCGAFNSNVIKEALSLINEYVAAGLASSDITVYSVGRKMADVMKKAGYPSPADFTKFADSPSYEEASHLAQELLDGFTDGIYDKVELVYNHFKSTSSQPTERRCYLPLSLGEEDSLTKVGKIAESVEIPEDKHVDPETIIVEPSKEDLLAVLLPKVIRLRVYTTALDSSAAEHAARTVAMQTATDNGNDLLQSLTLEYNKGRQQKITAEILDIVGGTLQ
jgi:ATP synthase, F1 gamma subunit